MEMDAHNMNVAEEVLDAYPIKLKPFLKWAGGKTQLLDDLLPRIPAYTGKYIEPFIGGGALFFALCPNNAIISDSNPELINAYKQIADNVDEVVRYLSSYVNTEEFFYHIRGQDWTALSKAEAAARLIYLNKTCFNGLYRVNKNGEFNVPYGRYKKPNICDIKTLYDASTVLKKSTIICGDYRSVLNDYAKSNDFIFLDPPYLPISEYADFKRYTKEQFYEKDHIELAEIVHDLVKRGCYVILTNSNHSLVHQLYAPYSIDVISTKRHISCNGNKRNGEDVIVTAFPALSFNNEILREETKDLSPQVKKYPATRFMGSKSKLLDEIWNVSSQFKFNNVVDLFSGSGVVGYMFKAQGKAVISNDHMAMSATFAKAMIENNNVVLAQEDVEFLLSNNTDIDHFVENNFRGLYFNDEDNRFIDRVRTNIKHFSNPYKKAIAMSALIRACLKKRPRGIFTYVGYRYDDGRRDLQMSFEEQYKEAVIAINEAVFDNGKDNRAINDDAMTLDVSVPDLVYMDPPYFSTRSDNEYVRRYHFVEGLARDWKGVEIQKNTKTKKFKSYETPFSRRQDAYEAFDSLFKKFASSILIVSYSSNCLPTKNEMIDLLGKYKKSVSVVPIDYTYSFGNQNDVGVNQNHVQEYLFVAY